MLYSQVKNTYNCRKGLYCIMLKYLFPLVFIIQCITNCIAQPLDKTFGNNGVLITPFDTYLYGNGDNIQAIAQQQDGKILSADGYFRIVRFLPNGKVDSSFAINGRIEQVFTGYELPTSSSVIIRTDGKIIVSGSASSNSTSATQTDFIVARYLRDGSIDNTFNGTGYQSIDLYPTWPGQDYCYGLALQADDKILLCGSGANEFAIVRLKENGMVDSSFGNNGIYRKNYGNYGSYFSRIAVRANGKIIAGGVAYFGGTDDRFCLLQLMPNGQPDSSFGVNGLAEISPAGGGIVHDMAVQPDGKVILLGRDVFTGGVMVRFNIDGSPDSSFGTNGIAEIISPKGVAGPEQIELSADGHLYIAGHIEINPSNEDVYFLRCNNDGTIDSTYAGGGSIVPLGKNDERIHSMLVQTDGKILMAGEYRDSTATYQYLLLRFNQFSENISIIGSERKLIDIYPNPVQSKFTVDAASDGVLIIRNAFGQVLQKMLVRNGESVFDFPDCPVGVYYCTYVSSSDEVYSTTLLKSP